ncbi:MAG: hypothetical protein NW226_17010 [Microscillaceae bacterium]|nr:hypothetical protein [Microscillaceae bacterium]
MNTLILYSVLSSICFPLFSQTDSRLNGAVKIQDTLIVAKVIGLDKVNHDMNLQYYGFDFYFGIFHVKVVTDRGDTLVLSKVYNKLTEGKEYSKQFGLEIKKKFIFVIYKFYPCSCCLPKLEGNCSDSLDVFYPLNNKIIESYTSIYNIIFASPVVD